jgi:hypothetical protein
MSLADSVFQAYTMARTFYKHAVKSNNKDYLPGADETKRANRAHKLWLRATIKPFTIRGMHLTPRAAGLLLRAEQLGAGNCYEMCCVAGSFLDELHVTARWLVGLTGPADHVFLVVGYLPQVSPTAAAMCAAVPDNLESYVLDVWAGICCHTRAYPAEFRAKMAYWSSKQKIVKIRGIWTLPGDHYVNTAMNRWPLIIHPDRTVPI